MNGNSTHQESFRTVVEVTEQEEPRNHCHTENSANIISEALSKAGINSPEYLAREVERMMQIPGATAVMIQPMLTGKELFIGAKHEPTFGHVLLCGLGGIFVDILKDVASGLAPLNFAEAYSMVRSLKSYKIIQ